MYIYTCICIDTFIHMLYRNVYLYQYVICQSGVNTVFSFQRIQAEPKCHHFACSIFKSAVSYNNCWEHLNENHCNRFPKVPKRSNSVDVFRIHCDTTTRRLHTSCTQAYIILLLWDLFLVTYLWLSKIIANESRHYLCESLFMACFSSGQIHHAGVCFRDDHNLSSGGRLKCHT